MTPARLGDMSPDMTSDMTTTIQRVPNQPKTPMHSFRCPDELWKAAVEVAAERDETVAELLRKALERYVKRAGR